MTSFFALNGLSPLPLAASGSRLPNQTQVAVSSVDEFVAPAATSAPVSPSRLSQWAGRLFLPAALALAGCAGSMQSPEPESPDAVIDTSPRPAEHIRLNPSEVQALLQSGNFERQIEFHRSMSSWGSPREFFEIRETIGDSSFFRFHASQELDVPSPVSVSFCENGSFRWEIDRVEVVEVLESCSASTYFDYPASAITLFRHPLEGDRISLMEIRRGFHEDRPALLLIFASEPDPEQIHGAELLYLD